jgi:hypothetical protein
MPVSRVVPAQYEIGGALLRPPDPTPCDVPDSNLVYWRAKAAGHGQISTECTEEEAPLALMISLSEVSEADANAEIGSLVTDLAFSGVENIDRQKTKPDTLDAGTLLYIAIPIAVPIARGVGRFLATRFGSKVHVEGCKGSVTITNVDTKDMAALTAKIAGIL